MSPVAGLLLLLACVPSCCQPNINPPVEDTHDERDSDSPVDSVDSEDTAPPPPCEQPEVEPNDLDSQATPIVLEEQACGAFTGGGLDLDWFSFDTEHVGWLKVDVDAADRGSEANVSLNLESDLGVQAAMSMAGDGSADPLLVIPVTEADSWMLVLNEQEAQSGDEDYDYQVRASVTKTPVPIDREEKSNNEDFEDAQVLQLDEYVYGTVDEPSDLDWYVLQTPPGRNEIKLELLAHRHGSPLNGRIEIWYAHPKDDSKLSDEAERKVADSDFGPSMDPIFTHTSYDERTWYIKVRNANTGGTGSAYWYVLHTTIEEAE